MEAMTIMPDSPPVEAVAEELKTDNQFILANTSPSSIGELRGSCIIPSFAKDNESTISHSHFIEAVYNAAQMTFEKERINDPVIRVSHPVKGRVPSAMGKPAKLLTEDEKTLYYERMAFIMEIPSIRDTAGGNDLSLTIGGVRSYSETNLYSKKTLERFKVFVGFKNKVCTNLCVSSDGFIGEMKVRSISEIINDAFKLFGNYDPGEDVKVYNEMTQEAITEQQFAQLVGRSRMYHFMPPKARKEIPAMPLMDSQVSTITRDYYADKSFCRGEDGLINLWQLYNLFTGANKSSYIDSYLERGVGSQQFVKGLQDALKSESDYWFIS
jgi:hypothetical protein